MPLTKAACASAESSAHRRIDDLQAHRRVGAQRRIARQKVDPGRARDPVREDRALASARALQRRQAADRLRPFERVEIILHAQHRRRVDGLALEDALDRACRPWSCGRSSAAARRRVAFEPRDGARREDQHAVRRLAAQRLLPGEGRRHRASANRAPARTRPRWRRRWSGPRGRRRSSRRSARARPEVVPFQVNTMSCAGSTAARSGSSP